MDDKLANAPLLVATAVSLFVLVLPVAAVAVEEEEQIAILSEAAAVIGSALVANRSRKQQSTCEGEPITRRRVICWDHQQAQQCIEQDYLGPTPSFGLDDFKRIFQVSRSYYDVIKRYVVREIYSFVMGWMFQVNKGLVPMPRY